MKRELLKLLQQLLRGELRRVRRRRGRGRAPLLVAVLTVAVFGVSQLLKEPKAPIPPRGAELSCAVNEVYDGDTVNVRCDDGLLKVRLWGIDAPEMGQKPWGAQSRDQLKALLHSGNVKVRVMDVDRYERAVARLYHGDRDLGLDLVRQGRAIVYERYNDSSDYKTAQSQARRQKLGIWSRSGPQQNPEAWRRVNPRG